MGRPVRVIVPNRHARRQKGFGRSSVSSGGRPLAFVSDRSGMGPPVPVHGAFPFVAAAFVFGVELAPHPERAGPGRPNAGFEVSVDTRVFSSVVAEVRPAYASTLFSSDGRRFDPHALDAFARVERENRRKRLPLRLSIAENWGRGDLSRPVVALLVQQLEDGRHLVETRPLRDEVGVAIPHHEAVVGQLRQVNEV